ncbi:thioredoxin family protein [Mucilaginibacter gracilis]|nr:thioredoxin family protein [Mucilaginibacter gracilis]
MKRILLLLMMAAGIANAQNSGIIFEKSALSASLLKAKSENKLVFVDCYTVWCGPCKAMAKNIFTIDTIGSFFNKNFVNVQLDMEKGEGKPATVKYQIEAYPSFLLLDGDGNLVYKFVGAMNAAEFMAKIKEGQNPSNRIAVMNKMYAAGNRSKDFLREYIKVKINMSEKREGVAIAQSYFDMLSPAEKVLPENWYLFGDNRYAMYLSDVHSRNFEYLANHWREFVALNGKTVVDERMANMFRKTAEYCLHGWYFKTYDGKVYPYQQSDFDHYRSQIKATELENKEGLMVMMDMAQAAGAQDTVKLARLFADKFGDLNAKNQSIVYAYMMAYSKKGSQQARLAYREAMDKVVLTAKDERIISLAKH